jgi:hypothetical protein
MRLTTKIVLGIIILVFLLSFGFIVCLSFIEIETVYDERNPPTISQENIISVDIEPFQTIWIGKEDLEAYKLSPTGTIRLSPIIHKEERNKVFLPEELLQFVDIISSNDTLIFD